MNELGEALEAQARDEVGVEEVEDRDRLFESVKPQVGQRVAFFRLIKLITDIDTDNLLANVFFAGVMAYRDAVRDTNPDAVDAADVVLGPCIWTEEPTDE